MVCFNHFMLFTVTSCSCTQTVTHPTRHCTASLWSWTRPTECWVRTWAEGSTTLRAGIRMAWARPLDLPPVTQLTDPGEDKHKLLVLIRLAWHDCPLTNKLKHKWLSSVVEGHSLGLILLWPYCVAWCWISEDWLTHRTFVLSQSSKTYPTIIGQNFSYF